MAYRGRATKRIPIGSTVATGVTALAAGYGYTCALTDDGSVYCWGKTCTQVTVDGTYTCVDGGFGGELANGTTSVPTKMTGLTKPAKSISIGTFMICAVLIDDTVQCWGSNLVGQLGLGDTVARFLPVKVPGLSNVLSIDAQEATTCAVHGAGNVSCWGANESGQIGDGTLVGRKSPTAVVGAATMCDAR